MRPANRLNSVQEYYFSRKLREVRQRMGSGQDVINMGIGSPDLPPPGAALSALTESLSQPTAHKYQSYQGTPALRQTIATYYQDAFDVALNPENEVLPLMGSKEGIMHISMAFLNEGDGVLIPNPGYPTYASVTELVGAQAVPYTLSAATHWLPNLEALAKQDLTGVKLMWVNYPHMPTGAKADAAFLAELVAFAKTHDLLIINDNPYANILNDAPMSLLQVPSAKDVALELQSLSKAYNMAGWRVGMVCGSAAHIQDILKVKSNMDSGMFFGLQQGAMAALAQGSAWFSELNATYRSRRELIWQLAEALGTTFERNTAGMFVWAKLPEGALDSEAYIDALLEEHHIFIAPGTIFGTAGAGYVRFSLCVSEERIVEALKRIAS
ncbi:MAG: pyridoxal phosphate-dependent aminotransferase [Flavobacteriaceae bacterium]|jgi:LL-diaminopimelate aminotransferase